MAEVHGGEQRREIGITVDSKCTQICRDVHCTSKSCSKIVLVKVYCEESPENAKKLYAIIDDQSNRSVVKSELLDTLQFRSGLCTHIMCRLITYKGEACYRSYCTVPRWQHSSETSNSHKVQQHTRC